MRALALLLVVSAAWAQGDRTPFLCIPFSAYRDGQAPGAAEPTYAQVVADVNLMKTYTRELRVYGSGIGSFGAMMPRICDSLGMKLHLGIWLDDTYSDAVNQAAVDQAIALIRQNHPSIQSVVVGNEFILRVRQARGNTAAAEARLIGYINAVQAAAPPAVAVTTAEDYGGWIGASNALFQAVDVVTWHVHPWWEQIPIQNAATHVSTSYNHVKNRMAANFSGKKIVLGEVGWPTSVNNGAAVGSDANQARFLKELHAWARPLNIPFWFFTNVDEKWKTAEGPVGGHWGMWRSDRTPKPIITGLADLIPFSAYWDNGPTPLRPAQGRLGGAPGARIGIYDLRGRLLSGYFEHPTLKRMQLPVPQQ